MLRVKTAVLIVAYCLALLVLLALGTWQIQRGLHKYDVLSLVNTELKEYQVLTKLPADWQTLDYQKVGLLGDWQAEHTFLLDNRVYQGQVGYEVLTPFQLEGGEWLLVNRGWVPRQQAQQGLPPPTQREVAGRLYQPDKGYTIGDALSAEQLASQAWPKITLYWDQELLAAALGHTLLPAVLVLDEQHPDGFVRIWQPVVISPERHYAYALQWYGLAVVWIIFGVIWYRRMVKKEPVS
ncbi:MAG: SURF1 family protein [Thiolinea sp.]